MLRRGLAKWLKIGAAIPGEIGREILLQTIGPRTPAAPGRFGRTAAAQGETSHMVDELRADWVPSNLPGISMQSSLVQSCNPLHLIGGGIIVGSGGQRGSLVKMPRPVEV